jgi:2-polyprenyl-3-methyl-5-hydroxy-6-metoxy-1,4-benzoquinol methylase
MEPVLRGLPEAGRVLHVGSDLGLLANEAALRAPEREVVSVQLHEEAARWAAETVGERRQVRFFPGPVAELEERDFDAVAVVDALRFVPVDDWTSFTEACFERVRPGGRFLLEEPGVAPAWKRHAFRLRERLARATGTGCPAEPLFADVETMRGLLHNAGVWDLCVTILGQGLTRPHVLYEGIRPA